MHSTDGHQARVHNSFSDAPDFKMESITINDRLSNLETDTIQYVILFIDIYRSNFSLQLKQNFCQLYCGGIYE